MSIVFFHVYKKNEIMYFLRLKNEKKHDIIKIEYNKKKLHKTIKNEKELSYGTY